MVEDRCDLLCLDLPRAEAVRAVLPDIETARASADRAKALADPSRLRVAFALAAGAELCVCDLAWVCGFAANLVSHHLGALRTAALVTSRRRGKLVIYRLTPTGATLLGAVTGAATEPAVTSAGVAVGNPGA